MDEEILQDFLVEAGEILEHLSEQLVDLEKSPDDTVLLNAIFRGFHTVKGGAGFLSLQPLVTLCHGAENIFDNLRNGTLVLTSEVMDTVLQALDKLNEQFVCLQKHTEIPEAEPELLARLHQFSDPSLNLSTATTSDPSDEITDDEFEKLLDEIHGSSASQEISQALAGFVKTEKDEPSTEEIIQTRVPVIEENKAAVQAVQIEQTIRVNTSILDAIMNMVGELVLARNRLISLSSEEGSEEIQKAVTNLDVVTADLQNAVMKTRMQPIKKVFGRFPRVVRDLARSLQKEIILEVQGEETGLDKNLVEALADPMVHLIRNSIDHGIELPNIREQKGKPREGCIALRAAQEGEHILLTIHDDGKGMDANHLRALAIERGLIDQDIATRMTDSEAFDIIFHPGFSTKGQISNISGRGVGMDVVKTAITQLNGSISIDSVLDQGTTISIKVPLTLAILPTLMVEVSDYPYAFPLSQVNEIIKLDVSKINRVSGQLTLIVRDKALPLFYMQQWLYAKQGYDPEQGHVVIMQLGHQSVALVVDTLIGQEEVVIKPLDDMLQGTVGIAGATITSDGQIALILDVPSLLKHYANR